MSSKIPDRIANLRGLGEKSEAMLARIDVTSIAQFMAEDPIDMYRRLKAVLPGTSLNMLYAMIGAQEDCPWQTIAKERRSELLMALDDIGLAPGKSSR